MINYLLQWLNSRYQRIQKIRHSIRSLRAQQSFTREIPEQPTKDMTDWAIRGGLRIRRRQLARNLGVLLVIILFLIIYLIDWLLGVWTKFSSLL